MNDQHIAFVLWICLYPVSIAIVRVLYSYMKKATPILPQPGVQDLDHVKEQAKRTISVGCIQVFIYWIIAYMLW